VSQPTRAFLFPIGGIDDGVVRLRLRSDADLEPTVEACRDPAITEFTRVPADYDLAEAQRFAAESNEAAAAGERLSLVIADAEDDSFLGSMGIVAHDPEEGHCEIGYWLAPWGRGRGAATRALVLLCRWIFDELEIERIWIGVEPENTASQAVPERVGFSREGILRSLFENKGRRRDVISYSLLRGELPQGD
jgi:RimJ/RimL family protein N-acetyltransferase